MTKKKSIITMEYLDSWSVSEIKLEIFLIEVKDSNSRVAENRHHVGQGFQPPRVRCRHP